MFFPDGFCLCYGFYRKAVGDLRAVEVDGFVFFEDSGEFLCKYEHSIKR